MKKRLIGGSILFLVLIFVIVISLAWDEHLHEGYTSPTLDKQRYEEHIKSQTQDAYLYKEYFKRPFDLNSYGKKGYYKIDPATILASLENGDTNVFEPSGKLIEITDTSISWTQADYLRIFSTFSKLVWNDSMDPKIWGIYDINFAGECFALNDVSNFDNAYIVYFKISGNSYTTRIMTIEPSLGRVWWGDETSYPLVRQWESVELTTAKITANDALKIAEQNGGREIRLRMSDTCRVDVSSTGSNNKNWYVRYVFQDPPIYEFFIDFDTGKYEFNEMYGLP